MKDYKIIIHKRTQQLEIRLFFMSRYSVKEKLSIFLRLISLFNIRKMDFQGTFFSKEENTFLDELIHIDRNLHAKIRNDKKGNWFEIDVQFSGQSIENIINFIVAKNMTVYICKTGNNSEFSEIELLVNDREFWSITFHKNVFDFNVFISKLDNILKEFQLTDCNSTTT